MKLQVDNQLGKGYTKSHLVTLSLIVDQTAVSHSLWPLTGTRNSYKDYLVGPDRRSHTILGLNSRNDIRGL